jgi:pimeloyl-ACP methyl ester carboxylesterase
MGRYTRDLVLLTLAASALAGCFAHAQIFAAPGKMVNVRGHYLHLNCLGKGRPTVVLEGGAAAGFSFDWALIQPEVATTTRVCSYDRAGYAWSDPGPAPRTLSQIAYEPRTALHAADEHGPFVLAGHSFGALIVRQFAQLYPEETAGLIFVDGTHKSSPLLLNNKVVHMRELSRKRAVPETQKSVRNSRAAKPMRAAPRPGWIPLTINCPSKRKSLERPHCRGISSIQAAASLSSSPKK